MGLGFDLSIAFLVYTANFMPKTPNQIPPPPFCAWWAILPPSDLLSFIDFLIQLSQIKFHWILPDLIYGSQNKKSMKVNISLGGSIAHLEAGSSQNF